LAAAHPPPLLASPPKPPLRSPWSWLVSTVDSDGGVQTHDGPVGKAKLVKVSTTLLGLTGRKPEKQRAVEMLEITVPK